MKKTGIIVVVFVLSLVYISGILVNRSLPDGHIIITRVPADKNINLSISGVEKLGLENAQIVSFYPNKPESSLNILTANFASAISPELSPDNRHIVFSAKKEPGDNWQIWLLNLSNSRTAQITGNSRNCFDPVFLPDERIAFSCTWEHERYGSGSTLYTARSDGSNLKPITFHPHADHSGTILHDGRILMVSNQVYPETGISKLLALRPDGTNTGLFYQIPDGFEILSKARENKENHIFFTAVNQQNGNRSTLIRFSYNNPYNSKQIVYTSEAGNIHSLYPENSGDLFISYQKNTEETYGIYRLDQQGMAKPIYIDSDYHFLEPAFIEAKPFTPRKLPSALREARNFGIVVFVETPQALMASGSFAGEKIQVVGLDGILDEFPVMSDGSFYVRMGARTPVRFQRVNSQNEIVEGPTSWLWLMTGERRGFTGWDEKQLTAPANRVPEAINHPYRDVPGFETPVLGIQADEKMLSEAGHENQ
ncbi:MAG: hypothetical protein EA359_10125 [Balneolaceae bacterium]|nr:MAG: hypothetical protein EA359_10125 [Balneolaceae bacterium]